MPDEKKTASESKHSSIGKKRGKINLKVYSEEMVEKVFRSSASSGRVSLPPDCAGCRVKIIRLD